MSVYYRVYKLKFTLAMVDPDLPHSAHHTAIFVQTSRVNESGFLHHVVGDIVSSHGMSYERKPVFRPDRLRSFYSEEFIGYTLANGYPTSFDLILSNVPAPPQQKAFNTSTRRTEPFKTLSPLTFYEPGEQRQPLIKCTEWIDSHAVPALEAEGLIVAQIPASTGPIYGAQTSTTASSSSSQASAPSQAASGQGPGGNGWVWDESARRYQYWNSATQRWIWVPTYGQRR